MTVIDQVAKQYGLDRDKLPVRAYMVPDRGQPWYDLGAARFTTEPGGGLALELHACDRCCEQGDGPRTVMVGAPRTQEALLTAVGRCPHCGAPFTACFEHLAELLTEYESAHHTMVALSNSGRWIALCSKCGALESHSTEALAQITADTHAGAYVMAVAS